MKHHTCPTCQWNQLHGDEDCPSCGPEKKPRFVLVLLELLPWLAAAAVFAIWLALAMSMF